MGIDRISFQTLVTKLDTGAITLKEARAFVLRFGVKVEGRTKEQFIKAVAKRLPEMGQLTADLAAYGFSLDADNRIVNPVGRVTGVTVWFAKGGRLQVRNDNKDLIWSGSRIGNFLESFWFSKPI